MRMQLARLHVGSTDVVASAMTSGGTAEDNRMLSVGPMAKGRRKRAQGPEQLAKQAVRSLVRGKRCKPKGWDDNMDWKLNFLMRTVWSSVGVTACRAARSDSRFALHRDPGAVR